MVIVAVEDAAARVRTEQPRQKPLPLIRIRLVVIVAVEDAAARARTEQPHLL